MKPSEDASKDGYANQHDYKCGTSVKHATKLDHDKTKKTTLYRTPCMTNSYLSLTQHEALKAGFV